MFDNCLIYRKLLIRHQTNNTDKQKTIDFEEAQYLVLKIPGHQKSKILRTTYAELVKKGGQNSIRDRLEQDSIYVY